MRDVIEQVVRVAESEGAARVVRVSVRLGALSHFTPEHFEEHFAEASRGTVAEGAGVDASLDDDIRHPRASDVVLEQVEVELSALEEIS
jgi:hydrogenase nickel incorporation protein HypA/HybF